MKTTLSTHCWGREFAVRADWSQSDDTVLMRGAAGEWIGTVYQVSSFDLGAVLALRAQLEEALFDSFHAIEDGEGDIKKALARARWED